VSFVARASRYRRPVDLDSVCVYCGSSSGSSPSIHGAAAQLGRSLAERDIRLVYGGGSVGLMGVLADATLAAGGQVVGVIPKGLFSREVAHSGLTHLHEVRSMHDRKQLMHDLSDAFVALPGGLGTLEELSEITTWAQLGLHRKPIVVLDVDRFWQPLFALLDNAVRGGFLKEENRALLTRVTSVGQVFDAMERYAPPLVEKWIDRTTT
jgi:uncharacterized protein (TIGR00730 family)